VFFSLFLSVLFLTLIESKCKRDDVYFYFNTITRSERFCSFWQFYCDISNDLIRVYGQRFVPAAVYRTPSVCDRLCAAVWTASPDPSVSGPRRRADRQLDNSGWGCHTAATPRTTWSHLTTLSDVAASTAAGVCAIAASVYRVSPDPDVDTVSPLAIFIISKLKLNTVDFTPFILAEYWFCVRMFFSLCFMFVA